MTSQFILPINHELIVDNFAGGGGASTGIFEALGRHVDYAINHDAKALGMHRINHPQTIHLCEDIFDIDPATLVAGRKVGLAWFSPDCKHFSKAKGGKPLSKKIRGLVLVILRWAAIGTRILAMENVEEIAGWAPLLAKRLFWQGKWYKAHQPDPRAKGRTWLAFLAALTTGLDSNHPDLPEILALLGHTLTREQLIRGFGYKFEYRQLRASDYGAPTIRKRLFMIARNDGHPIVWPEPTHVAPDVRPRNGRKLHRPVAECIDWHLPCPSIFLTKKEARLRRCKRPLADASLRRIACGIGRYVIHAKRPFLVNLTHQGGDRIEDIAQPIRTITGANRGEKALVDCDLARGCAGDSTANIAPVIYNQSHTSTPGMNPADQPIRTLCAETKGGHFSLVSANMLQTGHLKSNSKMVKGADEPMRTQSTRAEHAVVAASLVRQFGASIGQAVDDPAPTATAGVNKTGLVAANLVKMRGDPATHAPGHPCDQPAHTISAGGTHHALSACYLAQHNLGNIGRPVTKPLSTATAKGSQQQLISAHLSCYFGTEKDGQALDQPLRTISTKPRFGLAMSEAVAPVMTPEQIAMAHRVAAFLRKYGVEFEGEFAMVGDFVIIDIGMRMLTPRELFRAQGFPDTYIIDEAWLINPKTGEIKVVKLTKAEQIRMCGNSVSPPNATAIITDNCADLRHPIYKRPIRPVRRQSTLELQPA